MASPDTAPLSNGVPAGAAALSLLSPAKLNLFLHVTGRRPDGYHELQTLFQLLEHGDTLTFHATPGPTIDLEGGCEGVAPADNLIVRAARLLQAHTGTRQGAVIRLEKRLPLGGGLGGGSSNAATTLLALNHLWKLGLSLDTLAALGLSLGADVPVFVRGRSAWAEGVGERLTPLDVPPLWYLVVTPPCQVSTREIFSHPQLTRDTPPLKIPAFPILGAKNDCEPVACRLYPEIHAALAWLQRFGEARMTGTGASVFAAFSDKEAALAALSQRPGNLKGFLARGIRVSPVHRVLEGSG